MFLGMSEWRPLMPPQSTDQSPFSKVQEAYWTTKHVLLKKLGIKEDEHLIASDAQLDAKLELFQFIRSSCVELLKVLNQYQAVIGAISGSENEVGRLLKTESYRDKTCAGSVMEAVGKSQTYASQQILQMRVPLTLICQEVTTFLYRAVNDTSMTVEQMEAARAEYRGALLWMRDVSQRLDPDAQKRLNKFRLVQAQVKRTKARFDQLKVDTMQKVDLLSASHCNMHSHVLAKYQVTFLLTFERIARRLTAVAESIRTCQYYAFSAVKEIGEPGKKTSDETTNLKLPDYEMKEVSEGRFAAVGPLPDVPPIPKAAGTLLFHTDKEPVSSGSSRNHMHRRSAKDGDGVARKQRTSSADAAASSAKSNAPDVSRRQQQQRDETETVSFIDLYVDDSCTASSSSSSAERSKSTSQLCYLSTLLNSLNDHDDEDATLDPVHTLRQDMWCLTPSCTESAASSSSSVPRSTVYQPVTDSTQPGRLETTHGQRPQLSASQPLNDASTHSDQSAGSVQDVKPRSAASLLSETLSLQPVASAQHSPAKNETKSDAVSTTWFSMFAELDPLSNPDAFGRSKEFSVQA